MNIEDKLSGFSRGIVSKVFDSIRAECQDAIASLGDKPENYLVRAYPFSIERMDGLPVSKEVLEAIAKRLSND